ncbi:MAG: hypothetical protein B6242_07570 [Anaerolineaceae bacterium 4572_78]|nr:MAG: hypothetical protein B6242_07570 [Anaerolineaceae bacterium 4572_78]
MDIIQLLEELESIITRSPRFPFTSNIWVNEDELFDVLDQLRISIPNEIKEANHIQAERDHILERAQEEANRLIDMAKEKMMTAVDNHEIVELAKIRAEEIIDQSKQDALNLQRHSNTYAADHLSTLEEQLLKLLTTVRNGLRQLQETQTQIETGEHHADDNPSDQPKDLEY